MHTYIHIYIRTYVRTHMFTRKRKETCKDEFFINTLFPMHKVNKPISSRHTNKLTQLFFLICFKK